jgi:alcohol dehydrogenase (cytochrome c)
MSHAIGRAKVATTLGVPMVALLLAGAGPVPSAVPNPQDDWPTYGGSFSHQRFSRLRQVTTRNVHRLKVQWTYAIPDAGQGNASLQTTPLVVRGATAGRPALDALMLVTSPSSRVVALDAARGQPLWEFLPPLRESLKLCCSRSNRGVAFGRVTGAAGSVEPRVYATTLDARLWALSAATGEPVPGFGDGEGPAGSVTVADSAAGYSLTMAPLFISRADVPAGGVAGGRDVVIVGISGSEFATRGFVTAYDAVTGQRLWRFHTIPAPGEFGGDTWPADVPGAFANPHLRGGGAVWMTPAYDAVRGRIFFAVANPGPLLDGTHRAGDNLFTDSVVAVDVRTGLRVWHYQEVHHDLWDYDAASPPVLFDVEGRAAVGQAGKTGFFYILDRDTGMPLFPCPETPVPPSEIVAPDGTPELASPTQPVCDPGLQFVPLRRPGEPPSPTDPEHQAIFTPPGRPGPVVAPGVHGGSMWSPVAAHPELGLAFISGVIEPIQYIGIPERKPRPGRFTIGGLPVPQLADARGVLTAIDVNAGKVRWAVGSRWPLVGGALATAGGVVFHGEGSPLGGAFLARDAATGALLFRHRTRGGVNAAPITFRAGGRQMITVAAGGATPYLSRTDNLLVTFGLRRPE